MIKLVDKIDIARLYEVGLSFKDYLNTHEIMKVNNNTFAFISFEKGVGLTDSCISGAISAYEFLNKINFGCKIRSRILDVKKWCLKQLVEISILKEIITL